MINKHDLEFSNCHQDEENVNIYYLILVTCQKLNKWSLSLCFMCTLTYASNFFIWGTTSIGVKDLFLLLCLEISPDIFRYHLYHFVPQNIKTVVSSSKQRPLSLCYLSSCPFFNFSYILLLTAWTAFYDIVSILGNEHTFIF